MKILLLDIETAPNKVYTWGLWKQNISLNQIDEVGYTLSWAAKWYKDKHTMFSSVHKDGKKEMLKQVYALLEKADVVIHFNGTTFDIPILNQEFVAMGWTPPAPFQQIDMLRVVRASFRLTSNKLDFVLRFLGIPGKVEHKGMSLWRDCMAGCSKAWRIMERYNKGDVTKLEQVYVRLLPWIKGHPNYGLYYNRGEYVCPNCGSTHLVKKGKRFTTVFTFHRWKCKSCGTWSQERFNDMTKEHRQSIIRGV
jgi:predicted RNA-binding Zn-ribbon protein involved in translation (DUF1610 family)